MADIAASILREEEMKAFQVSGFGQASNQTDWVARESCQCRALPKLETRTLFLETPFLLQRMQKRDQLIHLRLVQNPVKRRHVAPAKQDDIVYMLVRGRHSAG